MGVTVDVSSYVYKMRDQADARARQRDAILDDYSYSPTTTGRRDDHYTWVGSESMNKDQYSNHVAAMYDALGEDYPGEAAEAQRAIYGTGM